MNALRIIYFNSPSYDFLTACMLEGFAELERSGRVEIWVTARSNYAPAHRVLSKRAVYRNRQSFQLMILGTNAGIDYELFFDIHDPDRSICIDGSDEPHFEHSPTRFALYFKRELVEPFGLSHGNVRGCPFAIERRWLRELNPAPRFLLSACFGPSTLERARMLTVLRELADPRILFGRQEQSRLSSLSGVLMGQITLGAWLTSPFAVGPQSKYRQALHDSQLSLSLPGAGYETGRRWEILGAGAALVSPDLPLRMEHPLVPGEHYVAVNRAEDLPDVLDWAKRDQAGLQRLRVRARHFCLAHHTSTERAAYVLDEFEAQAGA